MKTSLQLGSALFLSLAACGQQDNKTNLPSALSTEVPGNPSDATRSQLSTIACVREGFKVTPAGGAFLIQPFGRESAKSLLPVVEGDVVKFAVSDAETSCVEDMVQIGRWGTFETKLKAKMGVNGEPEFFVDNNSESRSLGEGRASPHFCRESDNCEFIVKQTGKYVVEYLFRARDTSKILLSGKMVLNSRPTYALLYGLPGK
jgi:hypothetical protein